MIEGAHRRHNPLIDEWVLVSAGRTSRPWHGALDRVPNDEQPHFDPDCYLCPGNVRANGEANPVYDSTFVFTNDFAALSPEGPDSSIDDGLLVGRSELGTCRVICFHPRHDLTLGRLGEEAIRTVIDVWIAQTAELGRRFRWVQVFENRGEAMGASNPHPHGQIWAGAALPDTPAREDRAQRDYASTHGRPLLVDYIQQEAESDQADSSHQAMASRMVARNDEWLALVPFWAVWPFEILLLPRRHTARILELDEPQRDQLAEILPRLLARYDNLFEAPFPYSMGWHGAPFGNTDTDHWQIHAHFFPPLLRSATVRKHMVGYELLAEAQRDLTPEEAAERLRQVSDLHYLNGSTR